MKRNSQFDEERFLKFGKRYLSEAFPNPDRIGCPPEDALRLAALQPQKADVAVTEHLSFCSPCFNHYMEFLAELRRESSQERSHWKGILGWPVASPLRIGALAMAVVVFSVAAYFVAIQREGPTPPVPRPPGIEPGPIAFSSFTLDLRELSPTRAPTAKADERRLVNLPRQRLDVTVVLPIGSEEGTYQLSLKTMDKTVWTEQAQAQLVEFKTVIRVKVDLAQLPTGTYTFEAKSASGFYLRQPIALQNPADLPEGKEQ